MTRIRTSLLAFCFCLLISRWSIAEHSFTNFPSPAGFIESSSLSPSIRKLFSAGIAPSELIGAYLPTNALAEFLNTGRVAEPTTMSKAIFRGQSATVTDARNQFAGDRDAVKQECSGTFDFEEPSTKKLLSEIQTEFAKISTNFTFKVEGMRPLGIIADRANVFAIAAIANYEITVSKEPKPKKQPTVMSLAWLRVGLSHVEVTVLHPFKDAEAIKVSNTKLLDWIKQIETQYNVGAN